MSTLFGSGKNMWKNIIPLMKKLLTFGKKEFIIIPKKTIRTVSKKER